MPTVSEHITIAAPLDQVWPLLSDPALVASCIPGATLSSDQADGLWRGSIRVKFGPTVAVFKGEASLAYDHTAHSCTIDGRGIDGRGASRALANGVVKARGSATTDLQIEGAFSVSGPLETFANAGGVHVARALLQEFSGNLARVIEVRSAEQPAPQTHPDHAHASPNTAHGGSAPTAQVTSSTSIDSAPSASTSRPATQSVASVREISAMRILWLAFQSWLGELFGKGKKKL